ncbi:MAG: phosphotransferase [Rhodobacteraceae bacterium]|nr:phosphotransferase [Paracoccaceae bacterium]
MQDLPVEAALALWGMPQATAQLVAQRENTVFRVQHGPACFALRFHRPGYRSAAELNAELLWMDHLSRSGFGVPRPKADGTGAFIRQLGPIHVSLLDWLPGCPAGKTGQFDNIPDPIAFCEQLGREIARMHDLTDRWELPAGFTRPDWRREGLLGEAPLWGAFWAHPHLTTAQRAMLQRARKLAVADLQSIEAGADQGLIHADLVLENIMVDGAQISFLDFDDSAIGFRDFELATVLCKMLDVPDFAARRAAFCRGYATRRLVDQAQLDLFLLLRSLTYVGWIIDRLSEPGGIERSHRCIGAALDLAETYLKRRNA